MTQHRDKTRAEIAAVSAELRAKVEQLAADNRGFCEIQTEDAATIRRLMKVLRTAEKWVVDCCNSAEGGGVLLDIRAALAEATGQEPDRSAVLPRGQGATGPAYETAGNQSGAEQQIEAEGRAELAAAREVVRAACAVIAGDGCLYRERYECDRRPGNDLCRRCLLRDAIAAYGRVTGKDDDT